MTMPPKARPPRTRRPRSVYSVGHEADPRFSMANERTMLAWLRTALAFVVTGVALVALRDLTGATWVSATAATVTVIGAAVAPWAYVHWASCEKALRLDTPMPAPRIAPVAVLCVVVPAMITTVVLVRQLS